MSILQLAVLATGFASTAFAQSWTLPVPNQEARFSEGDSVPLLWSSPYAYTNIQLFQGPQANDPSKYLFTQLVNASISQNSFTWSAGTLPSANLDRQAFFFRLSNAQEVNGPYVDSADILIQPAAAAAAQSSALSAAVFATTTGSRTTMMTMQTSTASSGASSTTASTTGSSSSAAASTGSSTGVVAAATSAAAAAGATTTAAADPYNNNHTSSFIGVGVGLGVPALLAAIAAAVIMLRKRKASEREKRADLPGNGPTTDPAPHNLNGGRSAAALGATTAAGAAAAGATSRARESSLSHGGSYLTAREKNSTDLPRMTEKNHIDMTQYPNQNQSMTQQQPQQQDSLYTPAMNTHRRPSNDVWLPPRASVAEQRGGSSLPFR